MTNPPPSSPSELTTIAVILVVGLSCALLLRYLLASFQKRRLRQNPSSFSANAIGSLKSPIYWTILAITISLVGLTINFLASYQKLIFQSLLTYLIVLWSQSLTQFTTAAIINAAQRTTPSKRTAIADAVPFLTSLSRLFIFFLGLYLIFLTWGINLAPLLALVSVIGAALSFAARDVVGNVLSGMSIFFSHPFQVGDYIEIDDKLRGCVKEIGLQMTQIQAENGSLINLPNSILVTKAVTNRMGIKSHLSVDVPLTLPLLTNYAPLSAKILQVATDNTWVLPKPKPKLYFESVSDKSVTAHLTVCCEKIESAAKIRHQLLREITPLTLTR